MAPPSPFPPSPSTPPSSALPLPRDSMTLPQSPLGRPASWASLSFADHGTVSEPKTGFSFPAFLEDGRRLLGTGVRRKSIMGLKNIDVNAFGVYADDKMMKKVLAEKYGKLSVSELEDSTDLSEDVLDQDLGMTVRLQIVYGRLSIRSVRSAFEESIGSRLKKFGGPYNDELLQSQWDRGGSYTKQAVGTIYTRSLHWRQSI